MTKLKKMIICIICLCILSPNFVKAVEVAYGSIDDWDFEIRNICGVPIPFGETGNFEEFDKWSVGEKRTPCCAISKYSIKVKSTEIIAKKDWKKFNMDAPAKGADWVKVNIKVNISAKHYSGKATVPADALCFEVKGSTTYDGWGSYYFSGANYARELAQKVKKDVVPKNGKAYKTSFNSYVILECWKNKPCTMRIESKDGPVYFELDVYKDVDKKE